LCGREPVRGTGKGSGTPHPQGPIGGRAGMPMALPSARIFTIFEGTSEIQRILIGRAVTGLDVR
jgi:alkylation response protein AidB-like acyl-CoA dehydrogenase